MKDFKGVKGFIIILILILLVVGYFYYLSNRKTADGVEEDVVTSAATEVLLLNFDNNYPPTPKEVVKQYLEITKVLHNEDMSDDEIRAVALKLEELFDTELANNKSDEDYIMDLKSELKTFKDNNYSIVNMYTSASTDVDYYNVDGYEVARLYGTFNIRTGQGTQVLREVFILRKDLDGHWKIYGFQPVSDEEEE